jgi:dephospho-CoA kinase
MPSLAITGTLGSGKSLLLSQLLSVLSEKGLHVQSYSADKENRRLLAEDQEVRQEIKSRLGREILDEEGRPDRGKLSALVSNDDSARKALEDILHPRLEKQWRPTAQQHRGAGSSFFIAEIPLLYEKGLEQFFDAVLVICSSDSTRKSRLQSNRLISAEQVDLWLSIQQTQDQKISLADHLFWNDGSSGSLKRQLPQLLRYLAIP